MRSTALAAAVVLLALLAAPMASADEQAVLRAPLGLEQAQLQAQGGQLHLLEGEGSMVLAHPTGSMLVWTYRVPCFQQDESTCLYSNAERGTRSVDVTGGSVTATPGPDASSYDAHVLPDPETTVEVTAGGGVLDVQPENRSRALHDADEAPDRFNRVPSTKGARATLTGGPSIQVAGPHVLTLANATLVVVDGEGGKHTVHTGWSWNRSDGQGLTWTRQLTLVRIENSAPLAHDWDGRLDMNAVLPLSVRATEATGVLAAGELAGIAPSDQEQRLEALAITVEQVSWDEESGGSLVVTQGAVIPDQSDPEDEPLSTPVVVGAGSAAVAVVALAAYYWPRLTWGATVLGLPMYSRIEKSELLDNEVREQLYEAVKEEPGIHAHALAETVDIGWGTTVYHLRRLEKNGMLTSEKRGRYRRFFPAAGYVARTREVLSVLQNDTTNAIARYVLKEPGTNQKGICQALDISPSLANWHLSRLIEAGLVDRERRGRTVHYTPGGAWDEVGDAVDPLVS